MYTVEQLKSLFAPEELLVILVTRLFLNRVGKEEVENYLENTRIDQERLYSILAVHGVRPLFYHTLTQHQVKIDNGAGQRLKEFYLENQARSMELAVLTSRVQTDLFQKGIQVIPFKGPAFSSRYYGNLGLRECTDVDFLARPTDITQIESYLKDSGEMKLSVPAKYMKYYRKHFKEIVYTVKAVMHRFSVEVHWILLNSYIGKYPQFDFFSRGIQPEKLGSLHYNVLRPDYDLLAVASNHFVKDMSVKFKYLVDIACLLSSQGAAVDKQMIESVSGQYHCRKRMDYGFQLVSQLLGVSMAEWKSKFVFGENMLQDALKVPLAIKNFDVISVAFLRRSLKMQDDNRQRFIFLRRCLHYFFLPTNNDIYAFKPPAGLVLALILVRPFRLAANQVRRLTVGKTSGFFALFAYIKML